jgi:hypothetical protein
LRAASRSIALAVLGKSQVTGFAHGALRYAYRRNEGSIAQSLGAGAFTSAGRVRMIVQALPCLSAAASKKPWKALRLLRGPVLTQTGRRLWRHFRPRWRVKLGADFEPRRSLDRPTEPTVLRDRHFITAKGRRRWRVLGWCLFHFCSNRRASFSASAAIHDDNSRPVMEVPRRLTL